MFHEYQFLLSKIISHVENVGKGNMIYLPIKNQKFIHSYFIRGIKKLKDTEEHNLVFIFGEKNSLYKLKMKQGG